MTGVCSMEPVYREWWQELKAIFFVHDVDELAITTDLVVMRYCGFYKTTTAACSTAFMRRIEKCDAFHRAILE